MDGLLSTAVMHEILSSVKRLADCGQGRLFSAYFQSALVFVVSSRFCRHVCRCSKSHSTELINVRIEACIEHCNLLDLSSCERSRSDAARILHPRCMSDYTHQQTHRAQGNEIIMFI